MKRAASAGMLLPGVPLPKKACLEPYALGPPHHPPPNQHYHNGIVYAAPEIVAHPLLTGPGGAVRLPDRLPAGQVVIQELHAAPQQPQQAQQQQLDPAMHGGGGYMQQLQGGGDTELFGQLLPGGNGSGGRGSQSPRGHLGQPDLLLPLEGGYLPQSPPMPREGSAENREVSGAAVPWAQLCVGTPTALCKGEAATTDSSSVQGFLLRQLLYSCYKCGHSAPFLPLSAAPAPCPLPACSRAAPPTATPPPRTLASASSRSTSAATAS